MLTAPRMVRTERAVRPCLPITLPTSCGATRRRCKVISAPVIKEPILGGSGIISGSFTVQSASDLALLLRAGALPAPITILEERTVGPDLGADSIHAGAVASIVGVSLGVYLLYTLIHPEKF